MKTESNTSVKTLVNKFKTEKALIQAKKIKEDKLKEEAVRKARETKIGEELISRFKHSYFSLDSSNTKVAKVIANIGDYDVLACGEDIVWGENNHLFCVYLRKLSKKFDITIRVRRVKPKDEWHGSGDDMVYYANPSELRVYFNV